MRSSDAPLPRITELRAFDVRTVPDGDSPALTALSAAIISGAAILFTLPPNRDSGGPRGKPVRPGRK